MDQVKPKKKSPPTTIFGVLLLAVSVSGAAGAQTQSPTSSPSRSLPPGLVQSGGVVTMQPVTDAGDMNSAAGPGGEHRQGYVRVLSASDHDLYERAFEAADQGDWTAARGLADQGHDPIARQIIQWRYLLDRNSGASFAEIDSFLRGYPDWPNRETLFARAECAIAPNMDPHALLSWFGARDPVSDIGKIRLGEALIATGSTDRGRALIQKGWIDGNFDLDQENTIIRLDGAWLTPDIDRQRLDHLLWHDDISEARRELPRVTAEDYRVGEVRLELRTKPKSGARMIAKLPDTAQNEPGIIFDRARLLRQQTNVGAIPDLLVRSPTREMAQIGPKRWWEELSLDARAAIQQNNYAGAYTITTHSGLTADDGNQYSEAEFMAGWLALRFLKQPQTALEHFKNLSAAVARPISRARAHYWEARAYEDLGDLASAWRQYKVASQTPETYYGQLALARLSADPELHLKEDPVDTSAAQADFEHETLTRAVRILADLGQDNYLRDFAVHDAVVYPAPAHIKLMAEDLVRMGFTDVAVRVAKEASYHDISLPAYSYPIIALPVYPGLGTAPEPALVLGIIRQETEFDPDAVSNAGARGIIQIMPSAVRHIAREGGLPYRPNAFASDLTYNLQLGMTELADELSDWGGSYVLAIAAYNAGPTNVRRWIAQFGDPRDARIDPIDWVEEIPFGETRNYVQRVLENIEVYRTRLPGHDAKLRILTDLYRPDAPQTRPLQYVPPSSAASVIPAPAPKPETGDASASQTVSSANASRSGTVPGSQPVSIGGSPNMTPRPKPQP